MGGFAVNMDLIAGLPGDDAAGFSRTLDAVLSLGAENNTVHTLSLKKGSRITLEGSPLPSEAEVGAMLDEAASRLRQAGYEPYYLYRQKFMSGGLKTWAGPGRALQTCITSASWRSSAASSPWAEAAPPS